MFNDCGNMCWFLFGFFLWVVGFFCLFGFLWVFFCHPEGWLHLLQLLLTRASPNVAVFYWFQAIFRKRMMLVLQAKSKWVWTRVSPFHLQSDYKVHSIQSKYLEITVCWTFLLPVLPSLSSFLCWSWCRRQKSISSRPLLVTWSCFCYRCWCFSPGAEITANPHCFIQPRDQKLP